MRRQIIVLSHSPPSKFESTDKRTWLCCTSQWGVSRIFTCMWICVCHILCKPRTSPGPLLIFGLYLTTLPLALPYPERGGDGWWRKKEEEENTRYVCAPVCVWTALIKFFSVFEYCVARRRGILLQGKISRCGSRGGEGYHDGTYY